MMTRFSERYGYISVRDVMQLEEMDKELRNGLWSVFFELIAATGKKGNYWVYEHSEYHHLLVNLWKRFYKLPMDKVPLANYDVSLEFIRTKFFKSKWFEVYDFLEFVAQHISYDPTLKPQFIQGCNEVLKQEMSGYRFVEDKITRVTSTEEVVEIEQAINQDASSAVSIHLRRALELLSNRTSPDYRNSIKESISSVEALCTSLTGEATLGQALKRLAADRAIQTHPALNGAFRQLYGYTSDAGGIRHALLEEDNLDFEDAKFMLVSCSAFVNYLQAKALKTV